MSGEDYLFNDFKILKADRSPCPVCGHPTGDCTGISPQEPKKIFGIGLFESLDNSQTHTILEDIYEERQVTPLQSRKVIKYHKGQVIPLSTAQELGLID